MDFFFLDHWTWAGRNWSDKSMIYPKKMRKIWIFTFCVQFRQLVFLTSISRLLLDIFRLACVDNFYLRMIMSFWEFRRSWISMLKDFTNLYLLFYISCYRLYQCFFLLSYYIFLSFCPFLQEGFYSPDGHAMGRSIFYFTFWYFLSYQLCCILQEKVLLFWRPCYGLLPFSWILSLNILTSAYRLPTMNGRQDCHKTLKCIQGFFQGNLFYCSKNVK